MQKERLFTYALWYYGKYFPSRNRLHKRLIEKSASREDFEHAWERLGPYLVEDRIISDTISNAILSWKSLNWIKNMIKRKEFDADISAQILEDRMDEICDFSTYEDRISGQIDAYFQRGKSVMYILRTLGAKYPYFRGYISDIVKSRQEEFQGNNAFVLYQKLVADGLPDSKIQSRMVYRGFSYGDYQEAKKQLKDRKDTVE